MRATIKLLLTAIAAAAAMAFAAAPANAVESIEVIEEDGAHCPQVSIDEHTVSGGCAVHAESEHTRPTILRSHVPMMGETPFSGCHSEFTLNVAESGLGFRSGQTLSQPEAGTCVVEPCDEATHQNIPWPAHVYEFAGAAGLSYTLCIRFAGGYEGDPASQLPCTLSINLIDDGNHEYEASTNPTAASSRCSENPAVSFDGHWLTDETEDTIALEHENDE